MYQTVLMERIKGIRSLEIPIHIGYHKTGSTFLQKMIFPQLGIEQLMLSMDVISKKAGFYPEELVQTLECKGPEIDSDQKKLLISQESLVGHLEGDSIWDPLVIARNLHCTFPNAKIFVAIRNQFDYILSAYTFKVFIKGNERRTLSKYLKDNIKGPAGFKESLQYDRIIRYYQDIFGRNRVLVSAYEQLAKNEFAYIERLCKFIGIEHNVDLLAKKENVSNKNRDVILFSRLLNFPFSMTMDFLVHWGILPPERPNPSRIEIGYELLRKKTINPFLSNVFSSTEKILEIDPELKLTLDTIYKESNHKLADLVDLDLQKFGYPW